MNKEALGYQKCGILSLLILLRIRLYRRTHECKSYNFALYDQHHFIQKYIKMTVL